ncbi:MAG: thiol-activated cytolysin family protein [Chloroflexi bacterium]|nr:thiol-activated cytolysin family protein [Chloroflexota bacterium]MCC6895179.1 thiol-activated cytolysin family protein [Anaerolineae bacterium]
MSTKVPLKLFWDSVRGDSYTTATQDGESDAIANGYSLVRQEGYIFSSESPETRPLKLFWNPSKGDNLLTSTIEGEDYATTNGYTFIRVEGHLLAIPQAGTVPLKQFWNSDLEDNFACGSPEGEQVANTNNYQFTRVEGYIFPNVLPPSQSILPEGFVLHEGALLPIARDISNDRIVMENITRPVGVIGRVPPVIRELFSDLSIVKPVDETIYKYLQSLPQLAYLPDKTTTLELSDDKAIYDGIEYTIKRQSVEVRKQLDEFNILSPIEDVIWPGCLIQGKSIEGGRLAPIYLERSAGELSITTDFDLDPNNARTASKTIADPSLASISDARRELLLQLNPKTSAGAVTYDFIEARTLEAGMLKLGINVKGANWNVDVSGQLNSSLKTNSVIIKFTQKYYTASFRPLGSPAKFFSDNVKLDDLKPLAYVGNPPCYVASVSYGRQLYIVITSTASSNEIKAAVTASWDAAISGKVSISGEYKKTLDSSTIRMVSVGPTGQSTMSLLTDPANRLVDYFSSGASFSTSNPGAPLLLTLRYINNYEIARVTLATTYIEPIGASAPQDKGRSPYKVWDHGQNGGNVDTGIYVARGDSVTITATGQIWAGVWATGTNGPEGWRSWKAGASYPLPNEAPHQLIAGLNNSNWRPIGSGTTFEANNAGNLWLGLNDDNPYNGNGDTNYFRVNVTVSRRSKEQLGLNGVGSTA